MSSFIKTHLGPLTLLRRAFKTTSYFCGFIFLSTNVFTIDRTSGASALPTLNFHGDRIILDRRYRWGRGVRVGDFIGIKHPSFLYTQMGKRVIGMPGDYVVVESPVGYDRVKADVVRIDEDGRMIEGEVLEQEEETPMIIQVPEGHCWLHGDNLPHSRDSRFFGPVPLALIEGKITARIWPSPKWIRNTLQTATFEDSV